MSHPSFSCLYKFILIILSFIYHCNLHICQIQKSIFLDLLSVYLSIFYFFHPSNLSSDCSYLYILVMYLSSIISIIYLISINIITIYLLINWMIFPFQFQCEFGKFNNWVEVSVFGIEGEIIESELREILNYFYCLFWD